MAPFVFRLDKVLRYRAHMEKRVRLQLSEAVNRVRELEAAVSHLGDSRTEAARTLAEERSRGIAVCRDRIAASFLDGLAERAAEEQAELEKHMERLELLRKLLAVAAAKKKSLESLRDVHLARYKEASAKTEQKFLDELAVRARKEDKP